MNSKEAGDYDLDIFIKKVGGCFLCAVSNAQRAVIQTQTEEKTLIKDDLKIRDVNKMVQFAS